MTICIFSDSKTVLLALYSYPISSNLLHHRLFSVIATLRAMRKLMGWQEWVQIPVSAD
jgi:hypothetical protein